MRSHAFFCLFLFLCGLPLAKAEAPHEKAEDPSSTNLREAVYKIVDHYQSHIFDKQFDAELDSDYMSKVKIELISMEGKYFKLNFLEAYNEGKLKEKVQGWLKDKLEERKIREEKEKNKLGKNKLPPSSSNQQETESSATISAPKSLPSTPVLPKAQVPDPQAAPEPQVAPEPQAAPELQAAPEPQAPRPRTQEEPPEGHMDHGNNHDH